MIATIEVMVDQQDVDQFTAYYDAVGRKVARAEMIPILKEHLEPMVISEKRFLELHRKSGALADSLQARSGSGDRPGTISVFSAATATPKQLMKTWGTSTQQKRGFLLALTKKGKRRKVFYADFVEKGHRIVKKRAGGQEYFAGTAKPVPFAQQAVDALGDQQAEAAAQAVLDHILGD